MNYLKIALFSILFVLTGFCASAQQVTNADSVLVYREKLDHSPRKATIYSAVLPGLGQIYNKKYWKAPLIYIGFAAFGYFIDWNNDQYVVYRQAYADIIDDDPNTNSFKHLDLEGRYDFDNPSQLQQLGDRIKRAKDYSRRNRDMVIISTAAFYAINIIDASVDAHFFDFDISDDLSFKWAPGPVYCANKPMAGIYCRIRF
ncbi:DUF5683 domain-containing protein [Sunxiuqinia sp. A32]|uniref:DUF5683 domain-containing protein n=1 Tax=Sunxiuqinia sp. A32 TaxID=3461496 RepID=UPI004045BB49